RQQEIAGRGQDRSGTESEISSSAGHHSATGASTGERVVARAGTIEGLLKFFESLSPSRRNEIAKWIAQCKTSEARTRRSRQIAERLMETMEAERELPPIMQVAFRQNPRAAEQWQKMSQSHRRAHLFRIFYYREPEARARRVAKVID